MNEIPQVADALRRRDAASGDDDDKLVVENVAAGAAWARWGEPCQVDAGRAAIAPPAPGITRSISAIHIAYIN
jgi:hypothetical protein